MPLLEFITLTNVSAVVLVIGALGIIALPKPIDKVIMFTILQGGFLGMVVAAKYLDVAMAVALFDPISTVIFLIAITKMDEIRKKKKKQSQEEGILA